MQHTIRAISPQSLKCLLSLWDVSPTCRIPNRLVSISLVLHLQNPLGIFGASSSSSMFSSCRRSRRSFKASSRTLWQRQQRWKILRLGGWPSHPNEKDLMKWHEMMCFNDFLHASSHKKPEFGPLKHKAWPWQHHAWCYWTVAKGSPARVSGDSRIFSSRSWILQETKISKSIKKQNEWEWKG